MYTAGKILFSKRKQCKITASYLAKLIGVRRSVICDWEKERKVPLANNFLKAIEIMQEINLGGAKKDEIENKQIDSLLKELTPCQKNQAQE